MTEVLVERIDKDLPLPEYQHNTDAGMDLIARKSDIIVPDEWALIKGNIKVAIPQGYAGFVYPRSGLALREGITVLNADGVIDSGYRGEVGVILINHGKDIFHVERGDRIAQFIVQEISKVKWQEVDDIGDSERGEGGFGHTGQ